MARKKSSGALFSSALRAAILAPRKRTKRITKRKRKLSWAEKVRRQARRAAEGVAAPAAPAKPFTLPGLGADATALRIAALRGLSRTIGGAKVIRSNPKKRSHSMRKRHTRRARARRSNPGNPVILSNGRRRTRRRRNAGIMRVFNPGLGSIKAIPGRVVSSVKSVASPDNLKKAAAIVVAVGAGWALPARFAAGYDSGLAGVGLTALAGAAVAAVGGALMPAMGPVLVLGAGVAAGLKALFIYGRSWLPALSGMGDFLTLGQIPASMIQGGRGFGDFLTTSAPVVAMGPGRSAALGGENFSDFT